MKLFRDLNHDDTIQFQKWARTHYEPFSPIDGAWHPVIQAECAKINAEKGENVSVVGMSIFTEPGNA
jgi:hypothetical protein